MEILSGINHPRDIKKLSYEQLNILAKEIRQTILDTVLENGGHLASSLGVVELIIAMHYVFDSPEDKIIFDVGHQCYAHKLLTGRYSQFSTLRQKGGIAGFPKREESCHDIANTGHSSTSLSIACGISRANKHYGKDSVAVSLIGDGALTGGLAYEALNDVEQLNQKQIVILNDNNMSISENVGSTSRYLLRLHGNKTYQKAKSFALKVITAFDNNREKSSYKFLYNAKNSLKYFLQGGLPFEQFGISYFGPVDGHNIEELIRALQIVKEERKSVILHVVTVKGRGYKEAEEQPAKYHGYSNGGDGRKTFSKEFGDSLLEIAGECDGVYGVTAAMTEGVGMEKFAARYPDRFADVGIAEGHAVTMCAGMAIGGLKPYFAVYSSFLQRAYDQIIHDVCLQNLPVTFCIDRAGLVPSDGETHQGVLDVSFLRSIPNMTVVAPRNNTELNKFIKWSLGFNAPLAVRYPKGAVDDEATEDIEYGKWEKLTSGDIVLLASGARMVEQAMIAAKLLSAGGISCETVNARFIKPLDGDYLDSLSGRRVYTLEDNLLAGGFGSAVGEYFIRKGIAAKLSCIGIEDKILSHATVGELLKDNGLDAESIAERIRNEA